MNGFELTPADRLSSLWQRLLAASVKQRDVLRAKNDSPLDPVVTARVRGEIAALNAIIALDTPKPVVD